MNYRIIYKGLTPVEEDMEFHLTKYMSGQITAYALKIDPKITYPNSVQHYCYMNPSIADQFRNFCDRLYFITKTSITNQNKLKISFTNYIKLIKYLSITPYINIHQIEIIMGKILELLLYKNV